MAVPNLLKAKDNGLPKLTKENEGKWDGDFFFIQSADTQFGLYDKFMKPLPPQITWEKEVELARMFVEKVNEMDPPPKFVIVCGDLVDAFPGDENRPKQLSDFFKVFSSLRPDIPLVCVCGNHDVGNTPTVKAIEDFRRDFGDDFFTFWVGGCRFIVVNAQYIFDGSQAPELKMEHHKWLEKQLESDEGAKHTVLFQHVPWFINDAHEETNYFNLPIDERLHFLDKMTTAGVSAIFCGHYHTNAGGSYKGIQQVVTSAIGVQLGDDDSGYRIVRVSESKIEHEYVTLSGGPQLKCRLPSIPQRP